MRGGHRQRRAVRSNVISSQECHARFGGVVPEIASRQHLEQVNVIVEQALDAGGRDARGCRAGRRHAGPGPGRRAAGRTSSAKALAAARELPFAPVDHLQGHVAANFLAGAARGRRFEPPFVCLIASGGHTLLALVREHDGFEVLGRTLDDAAGEAFDKGARMLGLGYPGGAALERLAAGGDASAFASPARPSAPGGQARARRSRRARLLLRRAEDGAALQAARAARAGARPIAPPIWPPPTRRRSSTACSSAPSGRWSRPGSSGWPLAAGSPPTACCASACGRSASTVHIPRRCSAPTTRR